MLHAMHELKSMKVKHVQRSLDWKLHMILRLPTIQHF